MKIRTIKYIVKEGGVNTYRNKIMTLASISIVIATLIVTGIFFLGAQNLSYNAKQLMNQPQMEVYCDTELDAAMEKNVEESLAKNSEIVDVKKISKKENFEKAKNMMGSKELMEGFDESIMPTTFVLKLKNPANSINVATELRKIQGIKDINFFQDIIDFYKSFSNWISVLTIVLLIVLLAFSVFIISNTIKLTIFARRREINIMKYIGATDGFIRGPFVIEGIIIGILGALISFGIVLVMYKVVVNGFNSNSFTKEMVHIISLRDIWKILLTTFSLTGALVGAISSIISLRRHLKV